MDESIRRIGSAKTVMDRGFSAVGPSLVPTDDAARALMLLSCRCAAVADAVMVLARHNHASETLPLLPSLLGWAGHMRWIAEQDCEARAREFFREYERPQWDGIWSGRRLQERSAGLAEGTGAKVLGWCREHLWGNAAGLPWAHVFATSQSPGVSAQEVLEATAVLMGEAVKALDRRWPGKFS